MKTHTIGSIDNLIKIASTRMRDAEDPKEKRFLGKAVTQLRLAQTEILAASRGPFSTKEKARLGELAKLLESEHTVYVEKLRTDFTKKVMEVAEPTLNSVRKKVKSAHGTAGLEKAEPHLSRWLENVIQEVFTAKYITSLCDGLSEIHGEEPKTEVTTADTEDAPALVGDKTLTASLRKHSRDSNISKGLSSKLSALADREASRA